MREGKDGVLGEYRVAVPFCLDELFFWGVAQVELYFGLSQVPDECACSDTVDG